MLGRSSARTGEYHIKIDLVMAVALKRHNTLIAVGEARESKDSTLIRLLQDISGRFYNYDGMIYMTITSLTLHTIKYLI